MTALDALPRATRRPAGSVVVDLLPVALVVMAEAAWISVIGGLLQEYVFRDPLLGIPELAAFVVAGILSARFLARRLDRGWPIVALGLVVAASVVGWLAAPGARVALADGIGPALAAHPGGLLAGLALLRGFAHARLPLAEDSVVHLLAVGVPGIVVATLVGGLIAEPFRSRFLTDSLGAAIILVIATTLALALARLTEVGQAFGFDWRRNPTSLGLMLALLAIAIAVAVPLSTVAGRVIEVVVSVALGPMLVIGLATGFDRTARRVLVFFVAGAVVVYLLIRLFAGGPQPPDRPVIAAAGPDQPSVAEQVMSASLGGLLLLAAIVSILVLAAVWMRRTRPPDEDALAETRTIDRGVGGPRRRRPRRIGRRPEPTTAAAAYVSLVADLDRHDAVRRDAAETPAEHAARLRGSGRADLSLDFLAADYALARYGGVELPPREDRRAILRWRMLRQRLVRPRPRDG